MLSKLRTYLEYGAFGVCTLLSEKLGIPVHRVRLSFIYLSFLTIGSPVIIYLSIAFWLNLKDYMSSKRSTIWDL